MSFNNIKTKAQGFTIVELLIVVVVIAILAAITIVSYNGITARANSSAAQSMASSVIKKSELYNTDDSTSGYPSTIGALNNSSKPFNLTGVSSGTPSSTNGKTTVSFNICGTGASNTAPTAASELTAATGSITGILVHYYDFANSRVTTTATSPASLSTGQVSGTVGTKNIACFQV